MFDHILQQIRDKVRARRYVLTLHAEEEMGDDALTVYDVESGLLTGEIIERQKDHRTGEWKYLVQGQTLAGTAMVAVAKLSVTGKLVVITVYRVWQPRGG